MVPVKTAVARMRVAGLEPLDPFIGSTKPWRCQCTTCGGIVTPSYHSVNSNNAGCLLCGRERTAAALRLDPDAAVDVMRAGGYEPLSPYPGSGTPWPCRCRSCNSVGTPTLDNVRQGYGCMACGRERTVAAHRLDPDQATQVMREGGFEPLAPYPGALAPWRCRCTTCGRESDPMYASVSQGSGCRYCGRHTVVPAEAAEFMLSRGLEPLTPYPGSILPWPCRCTECGTTTTKVSYHAYATSPARRGCVDCAHRRRGLGRRFDEQLAITIMHENGFTPKADFSGKFRPWLSQCHVCERDSNPSLAGVMDGKRCNYCSGHWVAPEEAADLMREEGFEPHGPYPGAMQPWTATCQECGKQSTPTYSNVRSGYGCRFCAEHGFDHNAPSTVYVMTNHELGAVKIGIGGLHTRRSRTEQHLRHGWHLDSTHDTPTGDIAYRIEQAVLRHLKQELGLLHFVRQEQMPQGGYTETFDRGVVSSVELRQLVLLEAALISEHTDEA
ncbi:hypothetical protein [Kitasatospora sp. NPDC002040]|uniref:hypothetical protein n=1 Tax=Kitasatospora sp. NPDC002040 TaxID=3154661 RepID=UPI00331810B3